MIFTTDTCFGCQAPIERAGGNFYCGPCIAKQEREQGDEREAFDAYHAWADRQLDAAVSAGPWASDLVKP